MNKFSFNNKEFFTENFIVISVYELEKIIAEHFKVYPSKLEIVGNECWSNDSAHTFRFDKDTTVFPLLNPLELDEISEYINSGCDYNYYPDFYMILCKLIQDKIIPLDNYLIEVVSNYFYLL